MNFMNVTFELKGVTITILAKKEDLFAEVVSRFIEKAGLTGENIIFFYNSKELKPESGKTLADYKIFNMAKIEVLELRDIVPFNFVPELFVTFNFNENKIKVPAKFNHLFSDVAERFRNFFEYKPENIIFYFGLTKLKLWENKTLQDYGINEDTIINVIRWDKVLCNDCKKYFSQLEEENHDLSEKLNEESVKIKILIKENDKLRKQLEDLKISSINADESILTISFVSMDNIDIGNYNIVCKSTDLFVNLEERIYRDFPQFKDFNVSFEIQGRSIKRFKTIDENKIKNNDIISIIIK